MEKVIVKVLFRKKVHITKEFDDYDNALDYAFVWSNKGYDCLVLRQDDGKTWTKLWFNPPETI